VQVASSTAARADLASIADRLRPAGRVTVNEWLVRAEVEPGITLSIFADGRAIVQGTRDESRARGLLARYVGS
jgi:adenylyltransferase/sulfurtransferase